MWKLSLLALLVAVSANVARPESPAFQFQKGQKVYILALDLYGDIEHSKPNLELQRKAEQQFSKEKMFTSVRKREDADFIFFLITDPTADSVETYAVVLLPNAEVEAPATLATLRAAATWEGNNHRKNGRNTAAAAAAGATLGMSMLFAQHSISKELIHQFHHEVFAKQEKK